MRYCNASRRVLCCKSLQAKGVFVFFPEKLTEEGPRPGSRAAGSGGTGGSRGAASRSSSTGSITPLLALRIALHRDVCKECAVLSGLQQDRGQSAHLLLVIKLAVDVGMADQPTVLMLHPVAIALGM